MDGESTGGHSPGTGEPEGRGSKVTGTFEPPQDPSTILLSSSEEARGSYKLELTFL